MKAESSVRSLFSIIREKKRTLTRNFLSKQSKTISRYPYFLGLIAKCCPTCCHWRRELFIYFCTKESSALNEKEGKKCLKLLPFACLFVCWSSFISKTDVGMFVCLLDNGNVIIHVAGVVGVFPQEFSWRFLNFLSRIIKYLHSFLIRIRLAVTSTWRLSRSQFNPRLSYKLLYKLRLNFVQGLWFL